MDFIEQIFGISPDGGSGVLEILMFLIPAMGIYLLYRMRSRNNKHRKSRW
jgi:hypothetical protein